MFLIANKNALTTYAHVGALKLTKNWLNFGKKIRFNLCLDNSLYENSELYIKLKNQFSSLATTI